MHHSTDLCLHSLCQIGAQPACGGAALLAETAICLTSSSAVPDAWQNAIVISGAAGVGVSLYLVHMYVTPIKQLIQVAWLSACLLTVTANH